MLPASSVPHLATPPLEAKHCLAKQQIAQSIPDCLVDERRRGQQPANGLLDRRIAGAGLNHKTSEKIESKNKKNRLVRW